MTYDELNARQYALAYAIAGGEDVPGLLDTVSTEDLVGFIRAERAQARDTQDALVSYAAAEAREAALQEAAALADKNYAAGDMGNPGYHIIALIG
jgi:hypothetical protein